MFQKTIARPLFGLICIMEALVVVGAGQFRMGENGFLEDNGIVVLPVGVYDVNSPDDVLKVKNAGLDVAEGMLPGIFEWCSQSAIHSLRWIIARKQMPEELSHLVQAHKGDPWNLAWYTFDEPNEMGITPSNCEDVYRTIKAADPDRPVIVTISPAYWYQPWSYSSYAQSCDIMATDPYPVGIGHAIDVSYVSESVRRAKEDSGKPVWAVLQAFSWPGKRLPTRQELRCMTYQALVHGASGVLYYTYEVYAWNYSLAKTPLWAEIQKLSREMHQLAPVLAAEGPPAQVVSGAHILKKHLGASIYIIAVNTKDANQSLRIQVPKSVSGVNVLFDNEVVYPTQGYLEDDLGPYSVRVYRISESLPLSAASMLAALGFIQRRSTDGRHERQDGETHSGLSGSKRPHH